MGEFGDRFARNLGGEAVQCEGAVSEPELAQCDRRAAKAVGLDRVAASGEVTSMDLPDQIGPAFTNDLGAVLVAEKIALDIEVARLDLGSHGSVAQDDAVGEIIEEMRCHSRLLQTAAPGFFARTPSRWQIATIRSARLSV